MIITVNGKKLIVQMIVCGCSIVPCSFSTVSGCIVSLQAWHQNSTTCRIGFIANILLCKIEDVACPSNASGNIPFGMMPAFTEHRRVTHIPEAIALANAHTLGPIVARIPC